LTSPSDESTGIPTGSTVQLDFDRSIDVVTFKNFVVMYGADYDLTSGPDSAMWIDKDTGNNPFYLRSPGFKGVVELQYRFVFYDLDTGLDIGTQTFNNEAEELAYGDSGAAHRVYITPTAGHFAPDIEYTLHILGDPDSQSTGVGARTVFDVLPDVGNTSDSGIVVSNGGYTGPTAETVNIEITTAGDIGTARYKWWFTSGGVGSAIREKLTNRRYRPLQDGIQVRFSGDDFALGDLFTIEVVPAQYMAASTQVVFTTNDGSYSLPPDSPSVPATSEPPGSVIPPLPGASTDATNLQVVEMIPADGAFNVSKKTNTITVLFDEELEASSITQDTVRLYRLPALGWFEGQRLPREMGKKLTVSGQTLTVEF